MDRLPTWPVASGSLLLGFGVAEATGVRALGGVVLVAAAGWCTLRWRRSAGPGRAAGLLGLYLVAFAASHVIAHPLGAWPSVLLVAAITGAASWALADAAGARNAAAA